MTFLLTFSCYGTHLHGDERGSWNDRAFQPAHPGLQQSMRNAMTQEAYELTAVERPLVLEALVEISVRREWPLIAAHVRSSHVHLVLVCPEGSERVLAALKAAATRNLNCADGQLTRRRWSRGGSVRPLRTPEAVTAAIRYVVEGQGAPMSVYRGL